MPERDLTELLGHRACQQSHVGLVAGDGIILVNEEILTSVVRA